MEKQLHTGELFRIATQEELLDLFGSEEEAAERAQENLTDNEKHADLAALWNLRGNEKMEEFHLAAITNPAFRISTMLLLHECAE